MKPSLKLAVSLTTILAATSSLSLAHRSWLLPSTTILSGKSSWVTVDAAISNDLFYANHYAVGIEGMVVTGPEGKPVEILNSKDGRIRTTFDFEVTKQGSYEVESNRRMVFGGWTENGKQEKWRGTQEELEKIDFTGKKEIKLTRYSIRNTTYVTNGQPNLTALIPENKGLELSFVNTHPNDLVTGEKNTFCVVHNGKPAKNITIEILRGNDRYHNDKKAIKLTTDAEGKFSFSVRTAGSYWIEGTTENKGNDYKGNPVSQMDAFTAVVEVLPE
ncbi:MAG: DUF4198 domain-containing protein [Akkermansiaceae bacterium]